MKKIVMKAAVKLNLFRYKTGSIIADNSGQSALDTAIVCLIAIVLGALILAGLYALIDSEVMPTLSQRIKDMFDYTN